MFELNLAPALPQRRGRDREQPSGCRIKRPPCRSFRGHTFPKGWPAGTTVEPRVAAASREPPREGGAYLFLILFRPLVLEPVGVHLFVGKP
jgi:hypothetical protein